MKPITQQKLKVFLKDLTKEYGEGEVVTRKQVLTLHRKNKDKYPLVGYVTRNEDYKVGRGKVLITTKDNVAEQVKAAKEKAAKDEARKLPKETRTSVKKLAKKMLESEKPKAKTKKKVQTTKTKSAAVQTNHEAAEDYAMNNSRMDDYVSQADIDEHFGGNDINDIVAGLK